MHNYYIRSRYLLSFCTVWNVSAMESSVSPDLPLPTITPHMDAARVHLRWPILASRPPNFHLRLWASATISFVFVLCLISALVTPSLRTTYSTLRPISAEKFTESYFPSPWVTVLGRHITGSGIHSIPECLSVSLVSGICRSVQTIDSWTSSKPLQFCFIFLFPSCSRKKYSACVSYWSFWQIL